MASTLYECFHYVTKVVLSLRPALIRCERIRGLVDILDFVRDTASLLNISRVISYDHLPLICFDLQSRFITKQCFGSFDTMDRLLRYNICGVKSFFRSMADEGQLKCSVDGIPCCTGLNAKLFAFNLVQMLSSTCCLASSTATFCFGSRCCH